MALADEDVARVRAATDLAALVGEHTALKRVGRRFTGLCPFHAERSPSFSVNAEEGLYYCFGCQASGDAITFVRAVEGCDFVDAVERLAGRAGITLRDDVDPAANLERGRRQELYGALAAAETFYHERLLHHPDAGQARLYLRARGYDGDVVRRFRLGFAPAGFDELSRSLHLASSLLKAAGLAHETSRGRLQDSFRERVIFPIYDPSGRPVALGGRVLPEELRKTAGRDPGPKYRNSSESPIYAKRRTLYGLNWAKSAIAHDGEAVVCEGYTDVIGFFEAGVPRAVATCGTALTEDHFRLLSRFSKRVVLAFDADKAGQNAAARIYEWERRHEIELAVALLPPGSDPGELARNDPTALADAVRQARPFLGFQVDRALSSADLRTPEGRARAAEVALDAVAEHPNELVRDQYVASIADRTSHEPDRLRALLEGRRRRSREDGAARPATATATATDEPPPYDDGDAEGAFGPPGEDAGGRSGRRGSRGRTGPTAPRAGRDALLLAVHEPERVAHLLEDVLFLDPVQHDAFRALRGAVQLSEAIEAAPPEAASLLRRLAASDLPEDRDPEGTFVALARMAAEATVRELEGQARLASEAGGEGLETVQRLSAWAIVRIQELRDPVLVPGMASPALDAAKSLVAWLRERQLQGSPELEG